MPLNLNKLCAPVVSNEITNEAESVKFWRVQFPLSGEVDDFFQSAAAAVASAITNKLNSDKAKGEITDWGFADVVRERRQSEQYLIDLCNKHSPRQDILDCDRTGEFSRTSKSILVALDKALARLTEFPVSS